MASLLSSHLEQISLCSTSIAELPFPGPKIFTNALLTNHDITSLIRDTEAHERALFNLAPPPLPAKATDFASSSVSNPAPAAAARRATTYGHARQPKNKAVAAVLGGDLYQRTRRQEVAGKPKGEIDVEVMLEGAEKLAAVYPIPGAADKIAELRRRHEQLAANVAHYEKRVARNAQELHYMSRPSSRAGYGEEDDEADDLPEDELETDADATQSIRMTKEDLEREMAQVRELERKRKALESRVTGFESDLKGLA